MLSDQRQTRILFLSCLARSESLVGLPRWAGRLFDEESDHDSTRT
jgi:hypothetical protein